MNPCARIALPARAARFASVLTLSATLVLASATSAYAGPPLVIIDNGTIALGIDYNGCLNYDTLLSPSSGTAPEGGKGALLGLFDIGTSLDGTRFGDPFEGWGFWDRNSHTSGSAYSVVAGGGASPNLNLVNWDVTGTGTVKGAAGDRLLVRHELFPPLAAPEGLEKAPIRITHDIHPSAVARLYEIEVTVENFGKFAVAPRYRRVVDWDIEPTPTQEFITIEHGPSEAVAGSTIFAFESPNPVDPFGGGGGLTASHGGALEGVGCPKITLNAEVVDCGPGDLGTGFDFDLPEIPPGGMAKFWLYYGASPTELGAKAALGQVGASAYSLGQASHPLEAPESDGTPMTFMLGFKAPWAIVDNGTVELGVDMFGALVVRGDPFAGGPPPFSPVGEGPPPQPPIYGLRMRASEVDFEGLAGADPAREGWGVADVDTLNAAGTTTLIEFVSDAGPEAATEAEGALPAQPQPGVNMKPIDFDVAGDGTLPESVGRRAIVQSLAGDPPVLEVIHDFRPAKGAPGLYEIVVVLENISGSPISPRYRRIADWAIPPSPGSELTTISYDNASPVFPASVDTGRYASALPLDPMNGILCTDDIPLTDCGPGDLGFGIDFVLDDIPIGGKEQFHLYYGSTFGEAAALTALTAVGAQAYSLGEPNPVLSPEVALPVYIFAFKDVLFVDDFETSDASRWSATVP